jgi:N-acetylglucosamine-6-phosphate deacetylase
MRADSLRGTLAVAHGTVLLATGAMELLDVRASNGRIAAIAPGLSGDTVVDAAGCLVLPGLIDLHTHALGRESPAGGSLRDIARLEAAHGATAFYPTLFAPPEESAACMRRHRQETDDFQALPQVCGFRLESPYLAFAGGGASRDIAPIKAETTEALRAFGGGHIRIWDVSPELPGACALIRDLAGDGIVCSLAHTHASIDEARAAVDAGARLVTHLFDTFVLPSMSEPGAYPAGLVDYLLCEDRLVCEIVPDGTHVAPLLVEKALRCKTPRRLVWVTDSNFGAGLPPGSYEAPGWGVFVIDGPNNGARLRDRQMALAGSALTPIDAFRNAIRLFHQDVATASMVSSGTPARLMGLSKGEISVGKDADLIVLNENLDLQCTIVAGEVAWKL